MEGKTIRSIERTKSVLQITFEDDSIVVITGEYVGNGNVELEITDEEGEDIDID